VRVVAGARTRGRATSDRRRGEDVPHSLCPESCSPAGKRAGPAARASVGSREGAARQWWEQGMALMGREVAGERGRERWSFHRMGRRASQGTEGTPQRTTRKRSLQCCRAGVVVHFIQAGPLPCDLLGRIITKIVGWTKKKTIGGIIKGFSAHHRAMARVALGPARPLHGPMCRSYETWIL
jgi:hypothetical protein